MGLLSLLAFGRDDCRAHVTCLDDSPALDWSMMGVEFAVACACFAIPLRLLMFARRRPDGQMLRIAAVFAAIGIAFGVTRLLAIWVAWQPDDVLQAATKLATSVVSVAAALAVWRLVPVMLQIPTADERRTALLQLAQQAEKGRHADDLLAALRESQDSLRFALEASGIGHWELDLRTGTTRRSLHHDLCFGYEALQPEWGAETSLRHVHPDDRDAVALAVRKAFLTNSDLNLECRVIWPDASLHWIQLSGRTRGEPGPVTRMLGIVMDATERKLAEQMRMRAQRLKGDTREIVESTRLKTQFLANMSHELRSPLNAIIGFSDMLYAENLPASLALQHKFIGHIRTSGHHLLQMVDDLLNLSNAASGSLEFFPRLVDLHAVLAEVNGVLFTPLHEKRLAMEVHVDPRVDTVITDPARLKQMLYHYLSNAIKFTPEGGRITVRALCQGSDRFRIEIEDTGTGIAEGDIARLFVEFQQLDSGLSKQHQGAGLGLALTRRLAEAQGGSVGVRSMPGQGSVFHFSLPLQPTTDTPAAGALRLVSIGAPLPEQIRIDTAFARRTHRVDGARGQDEGVKRVASDSHDALTLDLLLDRRHGLHALERIRRSAPRRRAPFVDTTIKVAQAGTAAFAISEVLTRPLGAEEVAAAVFQLAPAQHAGARIMVIDGDECALELMRDALGDLGVQCLCYRDGRQALEDLPIQRPAAIILDLVLPVFDGFEVLEQLHALPASRDIPVYVWTGMVLSDADYDTLALCASAVLRKGGGEELLLERLRRWRPSDAPAAVPGE